MKEDFFTSTIFIIVGISLVLNYKKVARYSNEIYGDKLHIFPEFFHSEIIINITRISFLIGGMIFTIAGVFIFFSSFS